MKTAFCFYRDRLGKGNCPIPQTPSPKTKPGRLHESLDTPRRVCGYISNVSTIDPKLYILKWLDARSTGVHCFRQRKETIEIATRLPPGFLRRESPQFTQLPRDLLYKRRLVALAAMRHRCQVGRVRLNHHRIQWHLFGCLLNLLRFWKRHIAGERDHKSQIEGTFGVPDGSSETMQDPAQST